MIVDFLTDPDLWFEKANEIKSTDDLLHFFNTTFLDKNLTLDFMEAAGVMDMFFILSDHLVAEKRFKEYLELRNIVKDEQKEIYKKNFIYFDTAILQYALYIGNETLAQDAFEQFELDPDRDIDVYLPNLRLIALYGKSEWVEEICFKNYDTIKNGRYYGEPALELAKYALLHRTEVEYLKFKEKGTFDDDAFFKHLERFDFDQFEAKDKEDLVNVLIKPIADASILKKEYDVDGYNTTRILANSFMRYAYEEKKMPFIVSGIVWELMSDYWLKNDNGKKPFHLDEKSFDKQAMTIKGFFNNYFCNTIALVLGGTYVYDFLYQIGLITEIEHKKAIKEIGTLVVVTQNLGQKLWKNGFFRNWQSADGVDSLEFLKVIENADISFNKIEEFEYKSHDEHYGLDNIDEKISKALEKRTQIAHTNYVPVRTEPKIGRNDPCTCGSGKKYKKCCGT